MMALSVVNVLQFILSLTLCYPIGYAQQVWLTLGSYHPTIVTNNTEIIITDIGEGAPGGHLSLTCHTDLTACCRNAENGGNGRLGQWTYPGGSVILQNGGSTTAGQQFYVTRYAPQLIRLNRRENNNPLTPTGPYCCTVPTTGGEMTFCANLVVCYSLPPINGVITYSDPTLGEGTVATYTCNSLYTLNGDSTRTCGSDGSWSGSTPAGCKENATVLTGPEALVSSNGSVVEGSVIQIYCTVEDDTTVTFTWTLNGSSLLNNPPHIRIKEDNLPERSASLLTDDSTSVLTVDNFRASDNGVYQCTATSGATSGNGAAVTLSVVSFTSDGALMLTNQPSLNEPVDLSSSLNDNRTGIALGGTVDGFLLTCTAGHQGDGVLNYPAPSVMWVRSGQVVDDTDSRITITSTTMTNGQVTSSLTITNFELPDAGVYQCVFTDDNDGGEVITSIPYQLDTGLTIRIERVSPEVIILRPPEKLVIEVRVSGDYEVLFWRKGTISGFIPGQMRPQEFPNYFETFVRDKTTAEDEGFYIVQPQLKPGTTQTHTITPSGGIDFGVIAPVDAITTSLSTSTVVIPEGASADISCRSMGAPVPSVTWEFNNQTTEFEQTDTETPFVATLTGTIGNRGVTPGSIESFLHIVSATYPDHDGVYTCIGTNSDDLAVSSSSAFVTVQVNVIPEVKTIATETLVIGTNITITCFVQRGNPSNYVYTITNTDTGSTTTGPTRTLTSIQISDLGTYRCDVTNDAGTGSSSVLLGVVCLSLPRPTNGMISYSDPTLGVGSVATFSCDPGYMISDATHSTSDCRADGQWSSIPPTCIELSCPRAALDIENGRIIYTGDTTEPYIYGTTAVYECNLGYELTSGDSERTCIGDVMSSVGMWSGTTAVCSVVDCGHPFVSSNGEVSWPTGTTFSSVAFYSCHSCYRRVGVSVRICAGKGLWIPAPPTCEILDCDRPPDLDNGITITPYMTTCSSLVTYSCDRGYLLEGVSSRTCQTNGEWSNGTAMCNPIDCGSLTSPDNGVVLLPGSTFMSRATYSCNNGYLLNGIPVRICGPDGRWSQYLPSCEPVDCGPLMNPTNGLVETSSGTTFMNRATYTCNPGHNLEGTSSRMCLASGMWSSLQPSCKVVDCGALEDLTNGKVVILHGTTFDQPAVYSCNEGYTLNGDAKRTCTASGQWSGSAPSCDPVDCGVLEAPANGHVSTSQSTHFMDTGVYSCAPGYNLTGCPSAVCQSSGTWSCDPPFCADNTMIQLKFGPTRYCVEWTDEKVNLIYKIMHIAITKAVRQSGYDIPMNNIQPGYFICYKSTTRTTYRTTITGTKSLSAVEYADLIREWVESGVTTRVLWYAIRMDKACPVVIASMNQEECV